jgi:hypothetical protein
MDGFLWNLIFNNFSKICREKSSLNTIWQEKLVFCVNTYVQIILQRMSNISYNSSRENQNTHVFNYFFFFVNLAISEIMWKKHCTAIQATDDSIIRAQEPCKLDNYIYRHTLRICNTYCMSTASMVTRAFLNVTSLSIWPVLFSITACSVDTGTSHNIVNWPQHLHWTCGIIFMLPYYFLSSSQLPNHFYISVAISHKSYTAEISTNLHNHFP